MHVDRSATCRYSLVYVELGLEIFLVNFKQRVLLAALSCWFYENVIGWPSQLHCNTQPDCLSALQINIILPVCGCASVCGCACVYIRSKQEEFGHNHNLHPTNGLCWFHAIGPIENWIEMADDISMKIPTDAYSKVGQRKHIKVFCIQLFLLCDASVSFH